MPYAGQLVAYVPAPVHIKASQRIGPRGVDAIVVGFWETHGKIGNSAMLIPSEALLTGVGSISPMRTRDFKLPSERTFPMARLREWNLMLKGARLVADCSDEEFKPEIDNLTDASTPHVPTVIWLSLKSLPVVPNRCSYLLCKSSMTHAYTCCGRTSST